MCDTATRKRYVKWQFTIKWFREKNEFNEENNYSKSTPTVRENGRLFANFAFIVDWSLVSLFFFSA